MGMTRCENVTQIRTDEKFWNEIHEGLVNVTKTPARSFSVNPLGADLVVCCGGGVKLHAHLSIIRSRTRFFEVNLGALNLRDYYDHLNQVAVVVPHVAPRVMKHCFEFVYTGQTLVSSGRLRKEVSKVLQELFKISIDEEQDVEMNNILEDVSCEFLDDDENEVAPQGAPVGIPHDVLDEITEIFDHPKRSTADDGKNVERGLRVNGKERMDLQGGGCDGDKNSGNIPPNPGGLAASLLYRNATFQSYQDFMTVFDSYCKESFVYYYTRHSTHRDPLSPLYDKFPLSRVMLTCKCFGNRPSTSKGLRRVSHSRTGCNFHVYLKLVPTNDALMIYGLDLSHKGHKLGPQYFTKVHKSNVVMKSRKKNRDLHPRSLKEIADTVKLHSPIKQNQKGATKKEGLPASSESTLLFHVSDGGKFQPGRVFPNYEEFQKIFDQHCKDHFIETRTKTTHLDQSKKNDATKNDFGKYKRIELCCKHFGSRYSTSTGCTFRICVSKTIGGQFVVKSFEPQHKGHLLGNGKGSSEDKFDQMELETESDGD